MIALTLTWYFCSIHFLLVLSMPANLGMGFNLSMQNNIKCMESERQILLSFKQALVDRYDILSSWRSGVNDDCCNWRGVGCSNNNNTDDHHIIRLDLHGSDDKRLMGKVSSSLAQLSHLNYLDLSYNEFDRIFLEDIGSLINLKYLNLSHNKFATAIPPLLGNLSKLLVLDLGSNGWLLNDNLRWLSRLSSLNQLDLSSVDLYSANDWVDVMSKLTLLQSLSLSNCSLPQPIVLPPYANTNFSRFLVKLDLSLNYDLNSSTYSWLINLIGNSLTHLDLAHNNLQGFNIDGFGNMSSLIFLNLRFTQVDFLHSPNFFKNLCNLKMLYLSGNNGGGLLSDFLQIFPKCVLDSLEALYLGSNKFFGSLPNFTNLFPSLKELDLSNNMLNESIPQSLGELSKLEYLGLHDNLLEGEVCEVHFSKLINLKALNLDGNSLSLNFKSDWVPPFQLHSIILRNCTLGPLFPKWLQTQNFSVLDISQTRISDIIPHWFWNNLSPNLLFLDLSQNNIKGEIPNVPLEFKNMPVMILAINEFEGKIPSFVFGAQNLDLSNNKFSDISGLCEVKYSPLYFLDICSNQIRGQLPNCWDNMFNLLSLSLAYNSFSGDIPISLGNLTALKSLNLRRNNFSGEFPSWFNFTKLLVFDVGYNNLRGNLPWWIGSRSPNLVRLILKSNYFDGNLPSSVCNLKSIEVLDISSNYICGSIPNCIYNFNVLTKTSNASIFPEYWRDLSVMWKGKEMSIHGQLLEFERMIDLSSNHLTGKIPNEITHLVGLISLNLSRNELTGRIPYNMGQLQWLDFLDLSRNQLFGPIPSGLSEISRLGVLDLSYNNLSEKIPTGTQLQSFPPSSYQGNPFLCGEPLKQCHEEISPETNNINKNEDWFVVREFFMSMAFGYIVGFWGIFATLIFHTRWRHAYFKFLTALNYLRHRWNALNLL